MPASEVSISPIPTFLPPARGPVVVAVSAGADSTALALLLAEAKVGPLHLAHVRHGFRPDAAAHEVAALGELSRRIGAPLHVLEAAPPPGWRSGQKIPEAAARDVRRARLAGLARELGARIVAVAHHARDQVETQLLQVARGGGLRALAAMAEARATDGVVWWRPLLATPPEELRAWLRDRGVAWVEDASNHDLRLRRNAIRHRLLPHGVAAADPLIERAPVLAGLAARALRRIADVADAGPLRGRPSVRAGAVVRSARPLARLSPALLHELVRAWAVELLGESAARTLARGRDSRELCAWLRRSNSGSRRSGDLVIERAGEQLLLRDARRDVAPDEGSHVLARGTPARLAGSALVVEIAQDVANENARSESVDPFPCAIHVPAHAALTIRVRRPGERIELERGRAIALGRLLNEISLPAERDYWPIVCVDGAPAWIPGARRHAASVTESATPSSVRLVARFA